MNAVLDATQTSGRKGQPYDWQALFVPAEPAFSDELDDLVTRHSPVAAESASDIS